MINSSKAFIITAALIVANGYVKALLIPTLPYETMVTALVTFGGVYLSKRIVQKMKQFKPIEQRTYDEQDI